mgnify:CR=1 FL=1
MKSQKEIMPKEDLRRLQLIELEMLLEVDRICRKNKIKYMISSGTLLGAVRHKGFIPWDDDLDTYMLREDFEKFCAAWEQDADKNSFFLQTYKTDPEYRWGYAKIRRKGTEYLRDGQEAIKCMSGVSMDIFILDNIPDSRPMEYLYHIIRRACIKTLWSVVGVTEDPVAWKRGLYHVLRHVPKNIPLGIMEKLARRSNRKPSSRLYCISFYRNSGFAKKKKIGHGGIPSRWFKEFTDIEFEGFEFMTIKNYMEYLSAKYKNMWDAPPKSQQLIHPPKSYNFDVDIDLRGRSVEEYMNHEELYLTEEDWKRERTVKEV